MKIKKLRVLVRGIIPLAILIVASWVYSQYERMDQIAERNRENFFENWDYSHSLGMITRTLYVDLLQAYYGDDVTLVEELVEVEGLLEAWQFNDWWNNPSNKEFHELTEVELETLTRKFILEGITQDVDDGRWQLEWYGEMAYFLVDHSRDAFRSTGSELLERLVEEEVDEAFFKQLQEAYQHVVILQFDEAGQVSIPFSLTMEDTQAIESFLSEEGRAVRDRSWSPFTTTRTTNTEAVQIDGFRNGYTWLPLRDVTVAFAVPQELSFGSGIYHQQRWHHELSVQNTVWMYALLAGSLIGMVALFVPIKVIKEGRLMKWLLKWPLELAPVFGVFWFIFVVQLMPHFMIETTRATFSDHFEFLNVLYDISNVNQERLFWSLLSAANVLMWAAFLGAVAYVIIYLKHLFHIGWKKTFKEHSFIIRNFLKVRWFVINDLSEPLTGKIFFHVFMHFIIISLFSATWFLGIPLAFLYSLWLFSRLSKHARRMRTHYLQIVEMTQEISSGNLDLQVEEELGVFDEIKTELVQIQQGLKKAVESEVTSQRMKTDLIANVSHDLKTPLTSIITYTDLLRDESLDPTKRQQYVETLDKKANRLKVLIEDLFEMSKVSSGNLKLDVVEVDVVAIIKQTLLELEDKLEEAALDVRVNFPQEKVKLMLDGERTHRVFENLILNMVKYAMPGTRAYIDVMEDQDGVQMTLRNISAAEINIKSGELTERFVRGDQSRHTEGSGLGLAIAKNIVELQGGALEIFVDGDLFKVVIMFSK